VDPAPGRKRPSQGGADALAGVDRVVALAEPLAAAWAARASRSTSVGRERSVLRAFGVGGLDADGRPLAGAVVDRWLAADSRALGGGIALPFAMASVEYDESPRELALDIASGAIDLAMEARLLGEPDRRAAAELEARRLGQAALDRIDANRTARRELLGVFGDTGWPWLGAIASEPTARAAGAEASAFVRAGADLVRVAVPSGRELASRLLDLGIEAPDRELGERLGTIADDDQGAAPAGSQRGLGALRAVLDELAAERRAYVRLATAAPALSAPEQAVVAAFERVDVVEADPFGEIVGASVDPDRALADHSFAHRLHARSGALLVVGPGPLAVAPDLARGMPPDPPLLAGRGLALQALAVRLAIEGGLEPSAVLVGALPEWLLDRPDGPARALAEIAVRRALFAGQPLVFAAPDRREGPVSARVSAVWTQLVAAGMPIAEPTALVVRTGPVERFGTIASDHRAAAEVGRAVAMGQAVPGLRGDAAVHAAAMLEAAARTLEQLRDGGWRAILGEPMGATGRPRIGADAVAERHDAFDALA
jgi:beta-lysine 5,6-aminomutase alpha subunit